MLDTCGITAASHVRFIVPIDNAGDPLALRNGLHFSSSFEPPKHNHPEFIRIADSSDHFYHSLVVLEKRKCHDPSDVMRNAMDEIRNYWLVRDNVIRTRYRLFWSMLPSEVRRGVASKGVMILR